VCRRLYVGSWGVSEGGRLTGGQVQIQRNSLSLSTRGCTGETGAGRQSSAVVTKMLIDTESTGKVLYEVEHDGL
jgi:hypothetical protein